MTSRFAIAHIVSHAPARARGRVGDRVGALAVAMHMQAGVAAPPRSQGPGRP